MWIILCVYIQHMEEETYMEAVKRIGGGLLGGVEGWFLGGALVTVTEGVEFTGSVFWGIIGAVIGALIPAATILPLSLIPALFTRSSRND